MLTIRTESVRKLIQAEIETARGRSESAARELITEMNDALEKLAMWAARDAKRRGAETRTRMDGGEPAAPAASSQLSRNELKARIRRGLPVGRGRVTAETAAEIAGMQAMFPPTTKEQADEIAKATADINQGAQE